jgi:hypothetical protein
MNKLNKVLSIFLLALVCLSVNAQDSSSNAAETKQEQIPEDFKKLMENSKDDIQQSKKMESLQKDSEILIQKNESLNSTSATTVSESKPHFPLTKSELQLTEFIFIGLIFSNFLGFIFAPFLRSVLISTPFGIFVKVPQDDAFQATKRSRYWTEFILLILIIVAYFWMMGNLKISPDENIPFVRIQSFIVFFMCQIGYLIIRFGYGQSTKCPKCKTTFAAKTVNSYEEPKSTYQEKADASGRMKVMETGVKVTEFICTHCNYEWRKTSNYKKRIGNA